MQRRIFITLLLALVFLVGLAAVYFVLSERRGAPETAQQQRETKGAEAKNDAEMKDEELDGEMKDGHRKDGEKKGGEWKRDEWKHDERKYAEKWNGGKKHHPSGTRKKADREEVGIPQFPWPPPEASARLVVPDRFFRQGPRLFVRDVEEAIRSALEANGYVERSYFAVPDGFALVTRLESFYDDGSSKEGPERWVTDVGPLRSFSLRAYLRALFLASAGHYRVIVFIVTPMPFSESEAKVSVDETTAWLNSGLNILPVSIGEREYSPNHVCTAMIYEFTQSEAHEATENIPGRISGDQHLLKSKIWPTFESRQPQPLHGGN